MKHSKTPDDLDTWIEVATSGLPSSVQTRLASEIEDHYASLLEKQLREGLSQTQAEIKALQQLGKANEVAKDYRDAPRDRYSKAMWAVVGLLVIHIIGSIGWAISQNMQNAGEFVYNDMFIALDKYLLPWNAFMSIGSAILIYIIARSVLLLLHEHYEVKFPKKLYWLFTVGAMASAIGMAVTSLMWWFENYMLVNAQWEILSETQETPLWSTVLTIFYAIRGLGPLLPGAILVLFSLITWKSMFRKATPFTQVLILMTGGVGGIVILNAWFTAFNSGSALWSWRFMRYYTPYVMPILLTMFAFFLFVPLVTFRIMSQSGRTLEAGE